MLKKLQQYSCGFANQVSPPQRESGIVSDCQSRRDIRPARTRLTIESLGAAAAAAAACKQVLLTHRLRGRVTATGQH